MLSSRPPVSVTQCGLVFGFTFLWLVGNGGMGYNYNYYYYHSYSSIPYKSKVGRGFQASGSLRVSGLGPRFEANVGFRV